MKKLFLVLAVLLAALTFLGAGYVLAAGGLVNAGYAVVPMLFALQWLCTRKGRLR